MRFGKIFAAGFIFLLGLLRIAHAAAPFNADAGIVLSGKVVTLNDAGDIIPNARVWVAGGKIQAMARPGEALPDAAKNAVVLPGPMVIYPGIIDLHNHPEYAIYPLMPISSKYRDRYEWRWYDDAYNRRITYPQEVLTRAYYLDLGLEVGRYGEYKALAGGTTTLQGGRTNLPYSKEECLVRNIENSAVEPRMASSRVDLGRSAKEWADMQAERQKGMLVLHLAEGPSPRMAGEFGVLKESNLLGPELIAIHGVGLTESQLKEMAAAGAKLVWSPLSNFMLYGKTANVQAARRAGLPVSLAPDWAPSGSKSSLAELKVADLVNKHELRGLFSDRDLVEMLTRKPAQAMGWDKRLGQIAPGYLGDLLVLDERHPDPYRNMIVATEENIQLVLVRGEPLYGDSAMLEKARAGAQDIEVTATFGGKRSKSMTPNCPGTQLPEMSVAQTMARIEKALQFDPADLAAKISMEQASRDLAVCNLPPPQGAVGVQDAKQLLHCRFGLPFEPTHLSPLVTSEDPAFFPRLMKNPNLPAYLQALPTYYGK